MRTHTHTQNCTPETDATPPVPIHSGSELSPAFVCVCCVVWCGVPTQVYRGHNKQDIIGVILVKELLEYVKNFPDSPVSNMKIRQLPRYVTCNTQYTLADMTQP